MEANMNALKLRAVGKSTGAIFPKELLVKLNAKEGDEIYVVETSNGILLTPSDPTITRAIDIAREGMREYREVFEALAK
jgi:putative addiction module antidote